MGAPKQKWTSEEEAALKAGILKHGAGKWRTILKDPEFSCILSLRSNVDLKDKWRNMSVTANGWGSREKARMAIKKNPNHQIVKHEENEMMFHRGIPSDEEIVDARPIAASSGLLQIAGPKKSISRLDNLIFEAITNLKEPTGSNKTAITMYIDDQYEAPPNFRKILSAKLKGLTSSGKLLKVNRKYRIAPSGAFSEMRRSVGHPNLEAKQRDFHREPLTKLQIDADIAKMRTMTAKEAAEAAARAVAEAEAAIAEAEQAAREAEEAEADAEVAQAFADAATTTLKTRNTLNVMVRG